MKKSTFRLEKWFLDFVGNGENEAMIFYAAKLSYWGTTVHYANWIHYDSAQGTKEKAHYLRGNLPKIEGTSISWHDNSFGVSGVWNSSEKPLAARLFDSEEGYLDWNCIQPKAKVQLKFKESAMEGTGYVEQLILTVFPWRIPMNELRWGRFHSQHQTLVWIDLRHKKNKQWVWLNAEQLTNSTIEDDRIVSAEKDFILTLDRSVVIESEKKIARVVQKITSYLPGFNKLMSTQFLGATNKKWLSHGEFFQKGERVSHGPVIHEWLNFNSSKA